MTSVIIIIIFKYYWNRHGKIKCTKLQDLRQLPFQFMNLKTNTETSLFNWRHRAYDIYSKLHIISFYMNHTVIEYNGDVST